MLALAQKTADEHTARARAEADQLVTEARTKVAELERASAAERTVLEQRVEGLRAFEREYRQRLRQYHETALKELDAKGGDAPAAAPAAAAPVSRGPGGAGDPGRPGERATPTLAPPPAAAPPAPPVAAASRPGGCRRRLPRPRPPPLGPLRSTRRPPRRSSRPRRSRCRATTRSQA